MKTKANSTHGNKPTHWLLYAILVFKKKYPDAKHEVFDAWLLSCLKKSKYTISEINRKYALIQSKVHNSLESGEQNDAEVYLDTLYHE